MTMELSTLAPGAAGGNLATLGTKQAATPRGTTRNPHDHNFTDDDDGDSAITNGGPRDADLDLTDGEDDPDLDGSLSGGDLSDDDQDDDDEEDALGYSDSEDEEPDAEVLALRARMEKLRRDVALDARAMYSDDSDMDDFDHVHDASTSCAPSALPPLADHDDRGDLGPASPSIEPPASIEERLRPQLERVWAALEARRKSPRALDDSNEDPGTLLVFPPADLVEYVTLPAATFAPASLVAGGDVTDAEDDAEQDAGGSPAWYSRVFPERALLLSFLIQSDDMAGFNAAFAALFQSAPPDAPFASAWADELDRIRTGEEWWDLVLDDAPALWRVLRAFRDESYSLCQFLGTLAVCTWNLAALSTIQQRLGPSLIPLLDTLPCPFLLATPPKHRTHDDVLALLTWLSDRGWTVNRGLVPLVSLPVCGGSLDLFKRVFDAYDAEYLHSLPEPDRVDLDILVQLSNALDGLDQHEIHDLVMFGLTGRGLLTIPDALQIAIREELSDLLKWIEAQYESEMNTIVLQAAACFPCYCPDTAFVWEDLLILAESYGVPRMAMLGANPDNALTLAFARDVDRIGLANRRLDLLKLCFQTSPTWAPLSSGCAAQLYLDLLAHFARVYPTRPLRDALLPTFAWPQRLLTYLIAAILNRDVDEDHLYLLAGIDVLLATPGVRLDAPRLQPLVLDLDLVQALAAKDTAPTAQCLRRLAAHDVRGFAALVPWAATPESVPAWCWQTLPVPKLGDRPRILARLIRARKWDVARWFVSEYRDDDRVIAVLVTGPGGVAAPEVQDMVIGPLDLEDEVVRTVREMGAAGGGVAAVFGNRSVWDERILF
ncbi:hypothetical protein AMAG_07972 [Allomyces macrogynus ATCC 38327]|uniref:Uncharacterized protein n=1 Tax=Allomyces macrogynus (strain ATCC 38327) TaxID=578462 RepID=A0A0L0SK39_ALLM3|nr:hypothetical protein AMAG_07972 [Allomyces macrogynus ATCC 38327]|eukprot:KNE62789.1 hypothetical protein AMAG_07972 [Allomyces macrogynus ATCC 38327]